MTDEQHPSNEESAADQPAIDPLTVGELISLQTAATYCGLSRYSLLTYARKGRLKAKKLGSQWVTTHAAVDEYLQSRDLNSIPKKYRTPS